MGESLAGDFSITIFTSQSFSVPPFDTLTAAFRLNMVGIVSQAVGHVEWEIGDGAVNLVITRTDDILGTQAGLSVRHEPVQRGVDAVSETLHLNGAGLDSTPDKEINLDSWLGP